MEGFSSGISSLVSKSSQLFGPFDPQIFGFRMVPEFCYFPGFHLVTYGLAVLRWSIFAIPSQITNILAVHSLPLDPRYASNLPSETKAPGPAIKTILYTTTPYNLP
jgi:hypothetical protein